MCNACGFLCCAYDGFSGCGCDHCECPACWDDEGCDDGLICEVIEDDYEDGFDAGEWNNEPEKPKQQAPAELGEILTEALRKYNPKQ